MNRGLRAWAPARLSELRLALSLLTRLPVGGIDPCPPMGRAAWAYPLAGIVPGLAAGAVLWGAQAAGLPPLVAAFLALAAATLATGGLHEDGLADMADGLSGGRTPERRLEIMRDSRIGSHGGLALMIATGLRTASLAALAGGSAVAVPLAAAILSRAALPALMLALPPARADGLGRAAVLDLRRSPVLAAAALGVLAAAWLLPPGLALAAVAAVLAVTMVIGRVAMRRLGGVTGDVLGAAQVVAETALLVLATAWV